MKKILLLSFLFFSSFGYCQETDSLAIRKKQLQDTQTLTWLAELSEKGMEISGDSIKTSKEFKRVLADEKYRALLYPKKYDWEPALFFMKKNMLKQTFWYFINLYPQSVSNKELIMKSILAYEKYLKMDEIMINTFYTFCFMDPEISVIKEGKPEIVHPDVLEKKLSYVKEMVTFIKSYRLKEKAKTKQTQVNKKSAK
jgi:hypothetical protein